MTSELLTAREAALRLKVHPKTVLRWIAAGQLRAATLPSGRKRIYPEDIDEMLAVPQEPTAS